MEEVPFVAGLVGVKQNVARLEAALAARERNELDGLARQEAEGAGAGEPGDVGVERQSERPPVAPLATSL